MTVVVVFHSHSGPDKVVGPFRSVTINRDCLFGSDHDGDSVVIAERGGGGNWTLLNDDTPYASFTMRGEA